MRWAGQTYLFAQGLSPQRPADVVLGVLCWNLHAVVARVRPGIAEDNNAPLGAREGLLHAVLDLQRGQDPAHVGKGADCKEDEGMEAGESPHGWGEEAVEAEAQLPAKWSGDGTGREQKDERVWMVPGDKRSKYRMRRKSGRRSRLSMACSVQNQGRRASGLAWRLKSSVDEACVCTTSAL